MSSHFRLRVALSGAVLFVGCNSGSAGEESGETGTASSLSTSDATDSTAPGSASVSGPTSTPATSTTEVSGPSSGETSGDTTPDPPIWRSVDEVDGTLGAFYSVWGSAPDDLFVVGGRDESDQPSVGVILHYDGAEWTDVAPADTRTLHWISPAGSDVWIVGQAGTALRLEDGAWVEHPTGTTERLWGVWGSAPDDVWAVGGEPLNPDPLLIHYDGAAWSEPTVLPETDASVAFKVWGSARDDVWVVGADGLALHFDGSNWSVIANESISDLISVYGNGDQVLAVGGRANARLARLTPTGMDATTLDIPGTSGVWMDAVGVATVVGDMGLVATLSATGLEPVVINVGTQLLLHAVFGIDGELWAVGGDHFDSTPSVGVVFRFGS